MKTLILGMGNVILTDDAAGIIAVRHLHTNLKGISEGIDFRETSWGGFRIIDLLRGYDRVIIIDSIKTGKFSAGHIHRLKVDDLMHTLRLNSFHDINFYTAIRLAEALNEKMPSEIDILAVEIENNYTISETLTPEIRSSINALSEEVLKILVSVGALSRDFSAAALKRIDTDDDLQHLYGEYEKQEEAVI